MRLLIVVIALCGVLVASEEAEFNEPSLCLQESNPFSYSHCIKKRDIGCQNGGFCGTCNDNSCQTCNGNSCKTTCNGSGCNNCPSGNCCNSQNCNICSGPNCCNSNNCNSCTNTCNNGCSTFACRSACLQTCQTIVTHCHCDWEQTNCFSTCRDKCIGDHCYETCFRSCKCDLPCKNNTTTSVPTGGTDVNRTVVLVENKPVNSNPVNISTIINLRNFISNKNIITNPINITNVQYTKSEVIGNKSEEVIAPEKCCYVIHPIHCFDIESPPYKRCIQKRHWECSNICISVVVHLVHLQRTIHEPGPTQIVVQKQVVGVPYPVLVRPTQPIGMFPVPPPIRPILPPRCNYINQYPWIQCGHYNVQGCGSCYVCGNQQFNPTVCSTQTTCPGLCRGGIVYDNSIGLQVLRYAPIYRPPLAPGVPLQMQMKNQRILQG